MQPPPPPLPLDRSPSCRLIPPLHHLLQIAVSPAFTAQQAQARLKIWETRLAEQGGSLLRPADGTAARAAGKSSEPTHCLVGDEPNAAAAAAPVASNHKACQIVHYGWLEGSLRKKRRLNEADFAPDALAEEAAASSVSHAGQATASGGSGSAGTAGGAGSARPARPAGTRAGGAAAAAAAAAGPTQAAVAKASAAAASAAAAGAPPPLRQLAIRSSRLTASDVQQLLLHLLAVRPRPHWLSIHVRLAWWLVLWPRLRLPSPSSKFCCTVLCPHISVLFLSRFLPQGRPNCVVLVELPGVDQHALRWEKPPALPQLQAAAKQRVEVQAVSASEVPSQTTVALLSVPTSGGRGGAGKKRKQPEPPSDPAAAAGTAAAAGAAAEAAAGQLPTAAQLPFPPEFYCCTPRQMRQLSYPAGCPEAAAAAATAVGGSGQGSGNGGNRSDNAGLPQLPPGWVSTEQQGGQAAASSTGGRARNVCGE